MRPTAQTRCILVLVYVTAAASILHYVDNSVFFDSYPEPAWITPHFVDAFWFVMTPVGVLGYVLLGRGARRPALIALLSYGTMNLLTLGHYRYASPWELPPRVNAFILLQVAAAALLLAASIRFLASGRAHADQSGEGHRV